MALEQFKTQVLLLHSQQSTLDALGAGFNDRYSVHFATSGSEALTTLGETPIHIIVSAQDLPGMSGLEALREAKKRSPDTIGILLADDETDGNLEALVGEQEVFQIVRGAVEPDALLKIVESAARRMRMLTLSKSANDNAANVDVPVDSSEGEHIVMETAENGSFIISDGTGRMPVLKPEKIGASPDTGGRNVDVLVLTKDSEFLETIRESARGLHNVHHAVTAQQAQDAARNNPVGVLVTDAAIAGNKIELLTQKLRGVAPGMVAIVAGRRDDGDMLMDLINRGQVYRFLLKPVSPGRARLAVEASVKHHLDAVEAVAAKAPPAPVKAAAQPRPAAERAPKAPTLVPERVTAAPAAVPVNAAPVAKPPQPVADAVQEAVQEAAKEPVIGNPEEPEGLPELSASSSNLDLDVDALTDTGSMRATARLMAEQAAAKSGSSRGGGLPIPVIGAGVLVALLLGGGIWYMTSGDPQEAEPVAADVVTEPDNDEPATAATPGETTPDPAVPDSQPEVEAAYVALLDNARFARDSGSIVAPAGDNAIEWYVAARDAAPDNEVIADELAALVDQVIGMAETALLEDRAEDAAAALQMAAVANPGNSRLNFLNAQLDQMQLRAILDNARAAVRESRFEDAAALLANAAAIPDASPEQIGQLRNELATARSEQQAEDVIARANARLAAGNLVTPSNDNARYFFELALASDPQNTAARQGLLVVASRLVLQARDAIDNGNLDEATALLDDARSLDPESAELVASDAALSSARERQADAERQAAVARQAAALAAAERRAAEQRRAAAASATLSTEPEDGNAAVADNTTTPATTDASAAVPGSRSDARRPTPAKPGGSGSAQPEQEPAATSGPQSIAVSQLTRVNYVAPQYPRTAQRRGTSGWVDVSFVVLPSGTVGNVEVIESTPGTVFDDAALDAVTQWRFEPFIEGGRPVAKQVAVRMSFNLQ